MSGRSDHPYLGIEEVISIPRLLKPAVSEDGTRVAWTKAQADWDQNEYRRHVYARDDRTGEIVSVTGEERQGFSPSWSQASQLAWLSPVGPEDERVDQIFVWQEGRAVQVTHRDAGVSRFRWGPDGRKIFYLSPDPARHRELKRRKERYGDFQYVDVDFTPSCLFCLDLETAIDRSLERSARPEDLWERACPDEAQKLAGGDGEHIRGFDVSRDGKRIAFITTPTPDPQDAERAEIRLLDQRTGHSEPLQIKAKISVDTDVLFSPDGSQIGYTCPIDEERSATSISTLEIRNLEDGISERPLLKLDESVFPLRWTDRGLVFVWQHCTSWRVSRLDFDGEITHLSTDEDSVTMEASVSADGRHLATITAATESPFEVYVNRRRLTDQGGYYRRRTLSRKEVISWESWDGTTIEGVLITPRDMEEDRRHPLLVVVHGGPSWAALAIPTDDPYYPYEQFVERGFIMLDVNYRGSSGYGQTFRQLNYRNLGIGDYQDVISGVDMLAEKGLVDPERVGIMGWSQGGYIAAMCATYSDRFAAASAGAGISNWYTYYCNTDIPIFTRHYLGDTPWQDAGIYARTSPITYVTGCSTPTLIQHGDGDPRVPTPNARELYRGLRDNGVDVRLVLFKGMGHGADKPGLHRAIMHQNLSWFCHHLLGDTLDSFWLSVEDDDSKTD